MANRYDNDDFIDEDSVVDDEFTDDSTNLASVDDVGGNTGYDDYTTGDYDQGVYGDDGMLYGEETPEEEEARKHKRNVIIVWVVVAALVLLGVGWGAWAIGNNNGENRASEVVPDGPGSTETATVTQEVTDTAGIEDKDAEIQRLQGVTNGLREDNERQRNTISDLRDREPGETTTTATTTATATNSARANELQSELDRTRGALETRREWHSQAQQQRDSAINQRNQARSERTQAIEERDDAREALRTVNGRIDDLCEEDATPDAVKEALQCDA